MRTTTPVTTGLTVSGSIATYNEFLTSRDGGQTFVDIEPFFGNLYTFNVSPSAETISEVFTGDSSTTLFESTCAIDATSRILVNIGGVAQLPTTHYTISANPTRGNKADIKILPAVANDVSIEVRHFPSSNSPWSINSDSTIYYTQGNVGIGTQSPSKRLTIAGEVSASGALIVGGDLEIGRVASPWIDGGSSIYYSDGNVGIGTTTPAADADLHIVGTPNGQVRIEGPSPLLRYADNNASSGYKHGTIQFWDGHFQIGGNEDNWAWKGTPFTIHQNGNVGIGTSAPATKLHIGGTGTSTVRIQRAASTDDAGIRLHTGTTQDWFIGTGALANDRALEFYDGVVGASRLHISENGNVGIGTTAPTGKLTVRETTSDTECKVEVRTVANAGGDPYIKFDGGGTNFIVGEKWVGTTNNYLVLGPGENTDTSSGIFVKGDGNVGIGTTAPQTNLHIFKAEGGVGTKDATITLGGYTTQGATIASYRYEGDSNSRGLMFSTRNTGVGMVDAMTITGPGKVGIGTTAPTRVLEIKGDGADFKINRTGQYADTLDFGCPTGVPTIVGGTDLALGGNGAWNEHVRIKADGNVGIGTTAPAEALTVAGSISAQGTIYSNGSEVGGSSGKVLQVVTVTTDAISFSTSSSSNVDITGLVASITPSSTSSKILVTAMVNCGGENNNGVGLGLTRGGSRIGDSTETPGSSIRSVMAGCKLKDGNDIVTITLNYLDSPSTTSAAEYKVQVSSRSGHVFRLNRSNDHNNQSCLVTASSITLQEIAG
jgi:hypothetical protein